MPKADVRLRLALCAALVFALNVLVVHRLFSIEFTSHMESTEGAFIAISKWAAEHWSRLDWLPLWFTGMPFDNVYQPGFHLSVAAMSKLSGLSPARAYHFAAAMVYCLGPVTLMLAAWYFTRRTALSVVTALAYSTLSPVCWLIPEIRADTGGWLAYRRYLNVIMYADTPHLTVVMLAPIALIAIDLAVVKRRWWALPVATVLTSAIILTNWPGTVGFSLAILAYILARHGEFDRRRLFLIGLAAYLIASPWVPPWTLLSVQKNAQEAGWMSFGVGQAVYALAVMGIAAFLAFGVFNRSALSFWPTFSVLLVLFSGSIVMSRYWFHFPFLPQAHRWHVEMEMAIIAAAVCFAARFRPALMAVAVISIAALPVVMRYANHLTSAIDVTKTTEYRIAKWFDTNSRGERVFVPGSVSMWMNNFTDVPQFAGCCDQGVPSFMHRVALYTIYSGQNAGRDYVAVSTLWMQAYGVHFIAVTGPKSGEMFHPYMHPEEFRGHLPELWRDGDDAIYEVPHLTDSLAHVINSTDAVTREPRHGLDIEPLRTYVAALLSTAYSEASFDWIATSHARIQTNLHRDQLVSVQVTYDPGWNVFVNGTRQPVSRDALDLILIQPSIEGPCTIDLIWEPRHRIELRIAAAVGWLLCFGIAITIRYRTRTTPTV